MTRYEVAAALMHPCRSCNELDTPWVVGWPISAEKSLNWTAKVGQLSEDLGEF